MNEEVEYKGSCGTCVFRKIKEGRRFVSRPNTVAPCKTCGIGQTEYKEGDPRKEGSGVRG